MPYKSQGRKNTRATHSDGHEGNFVPKLPHSRRHRQQDRPRSFIQEVLLRTTRRAPKKAGRGGRRGRGVVCHKAGKYTQRVAVKARVVHTRGRPIKALQEHLRYLQRDGAGLDGKAPIAFTKECELSPAEVNGWGQNLSHDRHHFRFIVSPERGGDLALRSYAGDLMKQMERTLQTELDWIAVAHHNTDNPHIHIVLRGVDDRGKDLVLSRDFISRGMRTVAREIATRELGLRSELELRQEADRNVRQERFTGLDSELERQAKEHSQGLIDLRQPPPRGCNFALRLLQNKVDRLHHLVSLGLAEELAVGVWKLHPDMPERLRALGLRGDIIKTMHAAGKQANLSRDIIPLDAQHPPAESLRGKVLHWGCADELSDAKSLVLEADDGRTYHVRLDQDAYVPDNGYRVGETVAVHVLEWNSRRSIEVESVSRGWDRGLELTIPLPGCGHEDER